MSAPSTPVQSPAADRGLIDALRGRNDEMGLGVEDLSECVETMSHATDETASSTKLAQGATDHVAGAASAVSAAAEELEASMREVGTTASTSLEVAARAQVAMGDVDDRVSRLTESAGAISSVVETVSRISSQTRMLALNATIEAARAGEAGRGFAVVAAEVKDLAGQTGAATVRITEQLESLAGDTAAVSAAVATIGEVLGRVEELQQTIAAAVEQQTAAIGELNRSAAESADAAGSLQESVAASAAAAEATQAAVSRSRRWLDQVASAVAAQQADFEVLGAGIPKHPLRAAITAHAAWKRRLRQAIDAGRVPEGTSIDQVRRDDVCEFGRWLHAGEGVALDARRSAEATDLHAQFHQHAASVLTEVAAGRRDRAGDLLTAEEGYAGVARRLTDLLVLWSKDASAGGLPTPRPTRD